VTEKKSYDAGHTARRAALEPIMNRFAAAPLLLALTACAGPRFAAAPARGAVTTSSDRAAVVVRVPMPWYAPRFVVRGKFRDALSEYEGIDAIDAKYFTISDGREFGGIYLWSSRDAAERHFDAAWHENVRRRRGAPAAVAILPVRFIVEGPTVIRGEPVGRRSVRYDGAATFARFTGGERDGSPVDARGLADRLAAESGLVRAFVVEDEGAVAAIALWATRGHAERARYDGADVTRFEAPLLVDATLRGEAVAR